MGRYKSLCVEYHQSADAPELCSHTITGEGKKFASLTREVVDLILRAYEYGPHYGLPLSLLNMSGLDHEGFSQTHEARVVGGQLLLAGQIEGEVEAEPEMDWMYLLFFDNACIHLAGSLKLTKLHWEILEEGVLSMTRGSWISTVLKCSNCETDCQAQSKMLTKSCPECLEELRSTTRK